MTQAELASRLGRPRKTVNEIIKGKAALEPETALQLESVLGTPAAFWMEREARWAGCQRTPLAPTEVRSFSAFPASRPPTPGRTCGVRARYPSGALSADTAGRARSRRGSLFHEAAHVLLHPKRAESTAVERPETAASCRISSSPIPSLRPFRSSLPAQASLSERLNPGASDTVACHRAGGQPNASFRPFGGPVVPGGCHSFPPGAVRSLDRPLIPVEKRL
jgi:DNA-binding XRE family transcriptional regulator